MSVIYCGGFARTKRDTQICAAELGLLGPARPTRQDRADALATHQRELRKAREKYIASHKRPETLDEWTLRIRREAVKLMSEAMNRRSP